MRVVAIVVLATLLAACSGSDRAERILPAWANTPPRPAPQYVARKHPTEEHGPPRAEPAPAKPSAEPQPAKPPQVQSHSEE
jgi:hypothetical protein